MSNNTLYEDQCILAFAVYGSCRQQEPLVPSSMSIPYSAEAYEALIIADGEGTVILPGLPAFLPTTVTSIRMVPNSFSAQMTISNLEPSQFQANFYTFDVTYVFTLRIELFDAGGNLVPVELDTTPNPTIQNFLTIGASYVFKGDLCGGNSQNVVAKTNFLAPDILYDLSLPFVRVACKADMLAMSLETICPEDVCQSSSPVNTLNDSYDPYDRPVNEIQLTIGLFAVYELIRVSAGAALAIVQTSSSLFESDESAPDFNSPSAGVGCYLPPCEKIDPCTYFNNMPFPFTDFDPDSC